MYQWEPTVYDFSIAAAVVLVFITAIFTGLPAINKPDQDKRFYNAWVKEFCSSITIEEWEILKNNNALPINSKCTKV